MELWDTSDVERSPNLRRFLGLGKCFLDRNITIEDRFVEPALMLACEAIASSV